MLFESSTRNDLNKIMVEKKINSLSKGNSLECFSWSTLSLRAPKWKLLECPSLMG